VKRNFVFLILTITKGGAMPHPPEKQKLIDTILEEHLPIPEGAGQAAINSVGLARSMAAVENGLDNMDVGQLEQTLKLVRSNDRKKQLT
jgi:hypothetical protein